MEPWDRAVSAWHQVESRLIDHAALAQGRDVHELLPRLGDRAARANATRLFASPPTLYGPLLKLLTKPSESAMTEAAPHAAHTHTHTPGKGSAQHPDQTECAGTVAR